MVISRILIYTVANRNVLAVRLLIISICTSCLSGEESCPGTTGFLEVQVNLRCVVPERERAHLSPLHAVEDPKESTEHPHVSLTDKKQSCHHAINCVDILIGVNV